MDIFVGDIVWTPDDGLATVVSTEGYMVLVEYDTEGFDYFYDYEIVLADDSEVHP